MCKEGSENKSNGISDETVSMANHQKSVLNLIKCFRQQWSLLCESERTTICSADDMLLMLQLAVAEVNKKNGKEFTASLSDVLLMWKHLTKDKLGLICDDTEAPENYDNVLKTYDLFLKNSNTLDLIDLHRKLSCATETSNLSSEQLLEFLSGCQLEDNDCRITSPLTPCKNNMDLRKRKDVVQRIFCSYLTLLVNSKNDIALAQVLNCPDRDLGREAFTDLKRAARNKQMSLFLVATSFIRTLELGGKGYAPSETDPLRKHFKGLSLFVHFIDKLNEILGEAHDERIAAERLLSAIKMHLIKGRGSGDPFSEAVMEVAQDLDLRIKNLINLSSEVKNESSTGISPARPRIHAINRGTALCGRETIKTLLILLDEEAANPPSKNKAELLYADEDSTLFGSVSILSLFRTPEQYSGSSPKSLDQRVQKCINKDKPKLKQNLIKSQFSCTYKETSTSQLKPCDFPSMSQVPTCIHPAPKIVPVLCFDEEPIDHISKKKTAFQIHSGNIDSQVVKGKSSKELTKKGSKRKQVDTENQHNPEDEPPQKKVVTGLTKTKEKAAPTKTSSKAVAKNKLIVGQAKLTSFFRV
ncbi:PCNA-interacting partner isoform X2 [Pyxicephalus adspersus]|uniref:PCNA-interacting partner isoform X2 n=1 Tax=Pyxicephalus adspersus TaxID=30357 RepID=UPI003B5AF45E